jgi:peptide/nickel transport system substrate-binding protein
MLRRSIPVIGLFALLLFSLSACQSENIPPTSETIQTESPAAQAPAPVIETTIIPVQPEESAQSPDLRRTVGEKTATIAFNQEFDMLNPLYAQALSAQIVYGIWSCRAWDFDIHENPIPVLVEEIPSVKNNGISADGREITLRLKNDIRWSDGEAITSQDFIFTHQMIIDPLNNISDLTPFDQVEAVSAPDAKTVIVRFKEPYAAWLHTLYKVLLPAHVLEPVFAAEGSIQEAAWNLRPEVGCGPYVYESQVAGESFTFKTNEAYWLDYPVIGKINIRFYPDDASKAQAIITGEADLSIFLIDGATQVPIMKNANMQILQVNSGYKEGIFFLLDPTNGHPALQDDRVRQAIAMAIDRDAVIAKVYNGDRQPIISYWDNTPYIDPSLQPWAFDPEKAKGLLDEAGWVDTNANGSRDKDGVEIMLTYGTTTSAVRQSAQAEIQSYLAQIGVLVTPTNYDNTIFFSDIEQGSPAATGQLDLFQYSARTFNFPDPGTFDFRCDHIPSAELPQGENWSYLCDEELEELFNLQAAQIDFEERQQSFHQISKLIVEKAYFVGLWTDPDFWAANPRLKNVQISGITPFYNILEWDIQP